MANLTKAQRADREEAIEHLRQYVKPGDTLYTILRHVSRSGMMRHVDVFTADHAYLSGYAAKACRFNRTDQGAIKVGGCGTDVGFEVVYHLGLALFPDGFECIGRDCPAADHSNGDRNYEPHHHERFQGGYALRQRWL